MELPMKFEQLIQSKGLTPSSFHKLAGLDRQVIYNYRKGKATPSGKNLGKIAKALNTSTDEVIACFN